MRFQVECLNCKWKGTREGKAGTHADGVPKGPGEHATEAPCPKCGARDLRATR